MVNRREESADEFLVLEGQSGDAWAFEQLILRYQKRLWHFAFRLTNSEDAAWEIVQETWLAVTAGLNKLQDASKFRTWIFGICATARLRAPPAKCQATEGGADACSNQRP